MLQDAGSVGARVSSPTTPTPETKTDGTLDHCFNLRHRRKTDSAVNLSTHAPQTDATLRLARSSRLSMMGFSRTATYRTTQRDQTEPSPAGPTTMPEFPSRRRHEFLYENLPDFEGSPLKKTQNVYSGLSERRITTDDPRDTGRARALTFTGTTTNGSDFSPAPSTTGVPASHPPPPPPPPIHIPVPIPPSSSSPSSPSRLHRPSLPDLPRLPQSRFSFEYQYPLRKIALTSHLKSPSVDISTPSSDSTSTPDRTFLYNRPRRSVPDFRLSHVELPPASEASQPPSFLLTTTQGGDSALPLDDDSTVRLLSPNATKRRKSSLYSQPTAPDVKRRMPSSTTTFVQGRTRTDEQTSALKGFRRDNQQDGFRASIADDSRSKNEDIFLNIARSDSGRRASMGRSELRRSRLRMSGNGFRSSTSRVNDQPPSPDQQLRLNTYESPLHHSQNGSPSAPYSYSVSAHPLEENGRSAQSSFASSTRSVMGLPRTRLNRASPEDETTPERRSSLHDSRSFRHSTLSTIRSSRQASGSEATERPRYDTDRSRQDGTESTLSTTAPSTVWDELEDLKSRIKKLELTGKLPPSSQEAISSASAERPRTATTTVTTMSSSPRHRRTSISIEADTITAPSPIHPLLQSALVKARGVVSKEVYTALEATATDAMALSGLLGPGKAPSGGVSIANGFGPADRQSRRKADSVCRSLTELCLALSDEQHLQQQTPGADPTLRMSQSNATDEGTVTPTMLYRPSMSQEPEEMPRRQSASRATSRLEARRASLANNADHHPSSDQPGYNKINDAPQEPKQTQSPRSPATMSRLSRFSVSLRTKRLQADDELDEHQNPHGRSISRSMTEIGSASSAQRPSLRQRISHGYATPNSISKSPQTSQPRTPATPQSGIPLRRSLMTPSLYTPATSRANILAGSRRYAVSSATAEASNEETPPSPRQEVSQTKIIAPSSRIASSYTPIPQNRLRTNSLGTRKFGIRQRPISTVSNSKSLNDSID